MTSRHADWRELKRLGDNIQQQVQDLEEWINSKEPGEDEMEHEKSSPRVVYVDRSESSVTGRPDITFDRANKGHSAHATAQPEIPSYVASNATVPCGPTPSGAPNVPPQTFYPPAQNMPETGYSQPSAFHPQQSHIMTPQQQPQPQMSNENGSRFGHQVDAQQGHAQAHTMSQSQSHTGPIPFPTPPPPQQQAQHQPDNIPNTTNQSLFNEGTQGFPNVPHQPASEQQQEQQHQQNPPVQNVAFASPPVTQPSGHGDNSGGVNGKTNYRSPYVEDYDSENENENGGGFSM